MRFILSLCAVLAAFQAAGSQPYNGYKNILSGGAGAVSHVFIDNQASPLRYENTTVTYVLQYVRNTVNGYHRIVLGYDGGKFTTPGAGAGRMFEDYFRFRLRGGYMHRLFSLFDDSAFIMGGFHVNNIFAYRDHYYFENRSELFIDYTAALHPVVEVFYRIGDIHVIRSQVSVSAAALLYHNPYSIRGDMQYSFRFFDSFRQSAVSFSYRFRFSTRLQAEFTYSFDFTRHSVPQRYRGANDILTFLIGYRM